MEAGSVRRGGSPYERGLRYCSRCGIYLRTDKLRCPFCGRLLRTRRRHSRMPKDPAKFVRTLLYHIISSIRRER